MSKRYDEQFDGLAISTIPTYPQVEVSAEEAEGGKAFTIQAFGGDVFLMSVGPRGGESNHVNLTPAQARHLAAALYRAAARAEAVGIYQEA